MCLFGLRCHGDRRKVSCGSGEDPGKSDVSTRDPPLQPCSTKLFVWRATQKQPPEMVSFRRKESSKGGQMSGAVPAGEALTPAQQRRTGRLRKQKLRTFFSDSGFEEDLLPSPNSSNCGLETHESGQLSSWFLQYGDVGFKIQREKETQLFPCSSLARQPQLTAEARCKLVSWLIPVHKHFRLSFECCCLSVNIMDRFLASTPIAADCFQLLGVTALLLASKLVEIGSPSVNHLLSLCCDAFTEEQLYNLERLILLRLNFNLTAPTLAFFLDYFTNCFEAIQLKNNCPGTLKTTHISSFAQKTSCRFTDEACTDSLQPFEYMEPDDRVMTHNLMEECQENMKLLVSLNRNTMDGMLTV
ncbi:cyclin-O isoform X2 [Oryzias melastigma]|uniref:G2/mitotic-specific cyclin-B2 n=1 Tax=Oryzias melastigma TaxID=30732 RepID=A0A3B3C9Y2_ORYME|nr:cyclin-O isoform X2 [Oryzias melastigma]